MESLQINTVVELVNHLRSKCQDVETSVAFNELHNILKDSVKIRYEALSEIGKKVKNGEPFDHLENAKIGRAILTANRNRSNFNRELIRSCNGLVLKFPTWEVLSLPTPMFNPKYRLAVVAKNIDEYDIKEMYDGTMVNLYWNESLESGKWCMSTTNGYDVSAYKWIGDVTYMDAFMDIAKAYPEFSFDKLNKQFCYTMGFRCHDFHPLMSDSPKIWIAQVCDLAKLNGSAVTVDECLVDLSTLDFGLPVQGTINPPYKGRQLLRWMQAKNAAALKTYLENPMKENIHYGFILQNRNTRDGSSNILLESSLIVEIKKLVYNASKKDATAGPILSAANRMEYILLRAFLGYSTRTVFIKLFPQYEPIYAKYNSIFTKLVNRVVGALKHKDTRESWLLGVNNTSLDIDTKLDKIAMVMTTHIEKNAQINVMNTHGVNLVHDFIFDTDYLNLYFTCLSDN